MKKRIGILTSGGDCPGLNATIRGVAKALYQRMEELARPGIVSLRTWSTNHAQIAVLKRRGYDCVRRIADDRGEGIDTIYFAKSLG